jgi:hypothetical protein
MTIHPLILNSILYLGPETVMPLASILAAVLGGILIFWRYIIGFIKKTYNRIRKRNIEIPTSEQIISMDTQSQLDEDSIDHKSM